MHYRLVERFAQSVARDAQAITFTLENRTAIGSKGWKAMGGLALISVGNRRMNVPCPTDRDVLAILPWNR